MAFVLLSSASLLGLSLKRALETPTGFNVDNLVTGRIALPWKNYQTDDARLAFVERLLPAIRSLPGVTYAAISYDPPFTDGGADGAVQVEGYEPRPGEVTHGHYLSSVTAEYWSALGIPLLRGRFLEDADNHRSQRVCVVDQDFAKYYWGDGDPIGRRIAMGLQLNEELLTTIVGVVASVKQNTLEEPAGHGAVYFPYELFNSIVFSLVVRTALPPASLAPSIEKAILQLDPGLPLDDVQTMQSRIDQSLVGRRSPAILAAIFAGSALLLAAIGTYGVLAYAVSQRRREIGVRMALGALPQQILTQFLELGTRLLLVGLGLGMLGAWAASRAMRSVLFSVDPLHAGVLAGTAAVMFIVVLLATMLPSRRAARVNPIEALRDE
jgi:predicted permease